MAGVFFAAEEDFDFDFDDFDFEAFALGDFFDFELFELLPFEPFESFEVSAEWSFDAPFSAAKAALGTRRAMARGMIWRSFMMFLFALGRAPGEMADLFVFGFSTGRSGVSLCQQI